MKQVSLNSIFRIFLFLFSSFLISCGGTSQSVNIPSVVYTSDETLGGFDEIQARSGFKNYLEEYNSPLADYTDVIFDACKEHDCDPCIIIAIGMAETTLGKNMGGEYNFWNYLPDGEGNKPHSYESWENSIYALAYEFGENGSHKNKTSLEAINSETPKFCASGCEHWMTNVKAVYRDLSNIGCDVNTDLTYPK